MSINIPQITTKPLFIKTHEDGSSNPIFVNTNEISYIEKDKKGDWEANIKGFLGGTMNLKIENSELKKLIDYQA